MPGEVVRYDSVSYALEFEAEPRGIPDGANVDAADHLICNGHLPVSFDGSGTIGGVAFEDEDALEYDGAAWSMAYPGSAEDPDWSSADLDAIHATVNLGPGPPSVFGQTVLVQADKVTFRWASSAGFRAVRGSFTTSTVIGSYGVSKWTEGTGISFLDTAVPPAGSGYWYLVKRGGCTQTSWQSVLGLEPGRDAAIP